MIFNNDEEEDKEVRISAGRDSDGETRLQEEAEEKLTDSSGSSLPSSGPSVESHQDTGGADMSKLQKQNKEIISLLEEIREEIVDEEKDAGGAPADQLL